jgi:hypothetical protein
MTKRYTLIVEDTSDPFRPRSYSVSGAVTSFRVDYDYADIMLSPLTVARMTPKERQRYEKESHLLRVGARATLTISGNFVPDPIGELT